MRNRLHHRSPAHLFALIFALAMTASVGAQEPARDDEDAAWFSEHIEPILNERCLGCHSHAAGEIEGGLTLDSRSGWNTGGSRGPAIVPGQPDQSLLIKAIRRDGDLQMPPDEPLSNAEMQRLVEWVRRGAVDPREPPAGALSDPTDWWSLRPLVRPDVPERGEHESIVRNPIDAFVQHRLHAEGLRTAPRADRRTLIRRLHFNLHGMPPTAEEVAAFISDPDPLAYEKLVDRLLDSPRYGERFARHWLDTVHFADTHGCEHDYIRPNAWRYRDYVIGSFNRDTSWPRFIREQLAADWFFPDETQLIPALGFIAAGPLEYSRATTAPVTFVYLDRDDIVAQTMAAFASTTATCARCHDHKFDPITQEDYYSLQAVFAGAGKGDREFDPDPATATARRKWTELREAAGAGDPSVVLSPEYADIVARWEEAIAGNPVSWKPLAPRTFLTSNGTTLRRLDDDSLRASGESPETDTYTVSGSPALTLLTAFRLDLIPDESLPMQGPGRAPNGNCHLSEFEALLFVAGREEPQRLTFNEATADWNQKDWEVAGAIDDNRQTSWAIFPNVGEPHTAVFKLAEPVAVTEHDEIVIRLHQAHPPGHLIGRFRISVTESDRDDLEVIPAAVQTALNVPPEDRSEPQKVLIAAHALRLHATNELAHLPARASVYAWTTGYSHGGKLTEPMIPKIVHVLHRGDIEQPGNEAFPGALSAIATLPARFDIDNTGDEAARRAALADWLASRENPLTWRSAVNRVWMWHFGRGLSDTPNDFGRMGEEPSHPDLLDWLAVWFRDDAGGSLKQLHRLILLSSTWQQQVRGGEPLRDGVAPAELPQSIDAGNRLLWRMNRRPLDAESFRDAVLRISGRLEETIGGPGVEQFVRGAEIQKTPALDYDAFSWNDLAGSRRSIYRIVWRGISDPFMESLDFPDLGLIPAKRGHSVSALQALTLFNNNFVLHHSQVLADQLAGDHETLEQQVTAAWRNIVLREPSDQEAALLLSYAQLHGLAAACRLIFNCNEFLFVD